MREVKGKKQKKVKECKEKKEREVNSKDYIHVRARRGQATDSHSLAERVIISCKFFFLLSFF